MMVELNHDMLLGSAIQLIKDINRISFLGERMECVNIHHMTENWLKQLNNENQEEVNDG